MKRKVRYQGAIIENHHMLLIKHSERDGGRSYWVIPGGGREEGETEEECVRREMNEETHLVVSVGDLLLKDSAVGKIYERRKTYMCTPISGEAQPGYEPELEGDPHLAITDVRWFDLRDETTWSENMKKDAITYPQVQQIRAILGYDDNKE